MLIYFKNKLHMKRLISRAEKIFKLLYTSTFFFSYSLALNFPMMPEFFLSFPHHRSVVSKGIFFTTESWKMLPFLQCTLLIAGDTFSHLLSSRFHFSSGSTPPSPPPPSPSPPCAFVVQNPGPKILSAFCKDLGCLLRHRGLINIFFNVLFNV